MKLAMCSLHERMPMEFPCIAIRHDDGRKATPHEVWEWAMSLDRKAREECERIALQYSQAYGQIDDAMSIARDIRATIKEDQP